MNHVEDRNNKHQYITKNRQYKNRNQTVIQLCLTEGHRLFRDAGHPGHADAVAHQTGAHQIPQPHRQHKAGVGRRLFKDVPHLSGKQVEPKRADGKQPQAEKHRPRHLVVAGQEYRSADADADTAQDRV